MLNVFDIHFSTPAEKAVSRICASKPGEIANIWLVLTTQIVMPVGYTILLLSTKQSRENQCNGASCFKKNVSEKISVINPLRNKEKSLCKLNSLTFATKKPRPLC
jgi:hypothetical protein